MVGGNKQMKIGDIVPRKQTLLRGDEPAQGLIASGYETACVACKEEVHLIEVPGMDDAVICPHCGTAFLVGLPEHAYS